MNLYFLNAKFPIRFQSLISEFIIFNIITFTPATGQKLNKNIGANNEDANIDTIINTLHDAFRKVTTLLLKHVYDFCGLWCNDGPARFP